MLNERDEGFGFRQLIHVGYMRGHMSRELAEILQWYVELGVDTAVSDVASGWYELSSLADLAERQQPPAPGPATASAVGGASLARARPVAARPATPRLAPDAAVMAAREKARQAGTLDELRQAVADFDACPLKRTAKNLCFADGQANAPLMLIGEAPGRDEDLAGRPFVGRAGQLLDKMLQAINCSRETNCYITNTVFWRPPGNRTPTPAEIQMCLPFVERQIALLRPKVVVLLGGAAAKNILGLNQGIMRLRGKWRDYTLPGEAEEEGGEAKIKLMATLHPAYLLRNPSSKRLVWQDLLKISKALEIAN